MRRCAVDCLTQLHGSSIIKHWGPSATVMSNFWKISSQTILSIARQILDNRTNEDYLKSLLDILSKILISRNTFLGSVMVSNKVQEHQGKKHMQMKHTHTHAHRRTHRLRIQKQMSVCKPASHWRLRYWCLCARLYLTFAPWQ